MLALVAGLAAERGARCKSFVEGGVAEDDVEFQSELVQVLCDVTDLALSVYVSLADRGRSQLPTAAVDRTVARGTSVARDDRES